MSGAGNRPLPRASAKAGIKRTGVARPSPAGLVWKRTAGGGWTTRSLTRCRADVVAGAAALALLAGLTGCAPGERRGAALEPLAVADVPTAEAVYGELIDALIPGMSQEKLEERQAPQQLFELICLRAARPGCERARAALCRAIVAHLAPSTPQPARVWMIRKLESIGRDECVAALAGLLSDENEEVRESARRALQHNPAPAAGSTLREALARAATPEWRVALINALAARRDRAAVGLLGRLSQDADADVARAAVAALGEIGGEEARRLLHTLAVSGPAPLREPAAAGLLALLDAGSAAARAEQAADLYWKLFESDLPAALRAAALRGHAAAAGESAVPRLTDVIRHPHETLLHALAIRCLQDLPGRAATQALVKLLDEVAAGQQCQILLALAARGEASARAAVLARLEAGENEVRLAALQALRQLGEASDVERLVTLAGSTTGPQREAARGVLARLRGPEADERLVAALRTGPAAARAESIRALAVRRFRSALPQIAERVQDESPAVRLAVLEALRELGSEADIAAAARLLGDEDAAVREAAIDTVVALTVSLGEQSARVARIESLAGSVPSPLGRASVVRAVGRLGGPAALEFVRSATRSMDAEVRDAAVRALCDWPDLAALEEVLAYARTQENETYRVLALRGIVRLAALPSERTPAETLALLDQAMSCATRAEDRRLVLAALGRVPDEAAVACAEGLLEDVELRGEALAAALSSIRSLAALERESATRTLRRLQDRLIDEQERDKLAEAARFLESLEGRLTAWQFAGPYQQEGKPGVELFDVAFDPEQQDSAAAWGTLLPDNPERPWVFDLSKATALKGDHRCAYFRTAVWSGRPQPARLELGSDDGLKVWLNGRLVHANNVQRVHKTGEDRVNLELEQGWNVILLKVTQVDGGWGFSVSLRAGEDVPPPGLRYAPRPPEEAGEQPADQSTNSIGPTGGTIPAAAPSSSNLRTAWRPRGP